MDLKFNLTLGGIFEQNNSDYDNYEDYEYKPDCPLEGTLSFDAVLLPLLYSLALVLGLLGYIVVLGTLVKRRSQREWSITDTLILHLGLGDILLLLTLPFWAAQAAQQKGWSFGTPFCKIVGAIYNINFYGGIYLLTCLSLDRYLFIIHKKRIDGSPAQKTDHPDATGGKPWMVQACCLSIWLFSLLLSIPDWIFLEALTDSRSVTLCTYNYSPPFQSATLRLASRLPYHIAGFFLPLVILLFCYSSVLRRGIQDCPRDRKSHGVVLALVLVFFLCWMPYNITLIVDTFKGKVATTPDKGLCDTGRTGLETGLVLTRALGCLHACLNPLLYLWLCGTFRQEVQREALGLLKGGNKTQTGRSLSQQDWQSPSLWDMGVAEEDPVPTSGGEEKVPLSQISQQVEQAV